MDLKGKVAIVTGAAKGIGKGCAMVLAQAGASVAIADLDEAAGRVLADEISSTGSAALAVKCDVSNGGDVRALLDGVVAHFGGLDILVNNAGYHISKNIEVTSGVRQADQRLSNTARARLTFSRMSEALAVQTKGLGLSLCLSM